MNQSNPGTSGIFWRKWATVISFTILVATYINYVSGHRTYGEVITKANLHQIQIAIERYETDHNRYPLDMRDLAEVDYGPLPENAFTGKTMKSIQFGSRPYEGEFTYIPVMGSTKIRAYQLIGYGSAYRKGMDVDNDGLDDHVVLILENGLDCCKDESNWGDSPLPYPLVDCLKFLKDNPQAESVWAPEFR